MKYKNKTKIMFDLRNSKILLKMAEEHSDVLLQVMSLHATLHYPATLFRTPNFSRSPLSILSNFIKKIKNIRVNLFIYKFFPLMLKLFKRDLLSI